MGTMHEEVKDISLEGSAMYEWDPWNPPCPSRRPTPPNIDLNSRCKLVIEVWRLTTLMVFLFFCFLSLAVTVVTFFRTVV